ncbi:hypothetical protein CW712_06760 [Candidatus Bathyarchaeota archaeon]|nr:MAG: hypothetical protein CW712_06760 [Candidatus Bathyarchaeota archaeon]
MKRLLREKKALSQPVTTMILLVIPVMLTGGVVMYAYQIIGASLETELIVLSNQKIWVYQNGTSFAAFEVDNIGGKDIVIDKLEVRGVEASWSTVYYFRTQLTVTDTLNCPNASGHRWTNFEYTPGNISDFTQASGDIPLPSGFTLVVYIVNPDNVRLDDIGNTISITVFTESAQYQVLSDVKSAETSSGN